MFLSLVLINSGANYSRTSTTIIFVQMNYRYTKFHEYFARLVKHRSISVSNGVMNVSPPVVLQQQMRVFKRNDIFALKLILQIVALSWQRCISVKDS